MAQRPEVVPWATAGWGGLPLGTPGCCAWGRPLVRADPQTQGTVEHLHGTIAAQVVAPRSRPDSGAAQHAFSPVRTVFTRQHPPDALVDAVPASRDPSAATRPGTHPAPHPVPP